MAERANKGFNGRPGKGGKIKHRPTLAFPLTIIAGKTARERLEAEGWQPHLFQAMVGASGGAKLLGLGHLDRFLFSDFLQRSDHPMELYGSSIGSWRHAALASPDPAQAIETLQDRYLNQKREDNETRRPTEVVDELCEWVMDGVLTPGTATHISEQTRFTTHIVTARGRGLNSCNSNGAVALGMALAAISNSINRNFLGYGFQRAVFSSGASTAFQFKDFDTVHVPLSSTNLRSALLASGSIPFLMSGHRDITGAPTGQYWDGGIIDYHFDFDNYAGDGLVLYPHFTDSITKGWFDKTIPWRRIRPAVLDRLVLVAPSTSYIASLPNQKIPDRGDFQRFSLHQRLEYWNQAIDRSKLLAEAFEETLGEPNPLARLAKER
jgi:hypothetical protein